MLVYFNVLVLIKSYPFARPQPEDAAREKDMPHADVFGKTTDRCGIPSRNPQQRGAKSIESAAPTGRALLCGLWFRRRQ